MAEVVLIAAAVPVRGTDTGILALDGKIPWEDADDHQWFLDTTLDGVCVMGRKTWEAMPKRRTLGHCAAVVVVSSRPVDMAGVHTAATPLLALDEARALSGAHGGARIYVCGGEDVYASLWPHVDIALITHISPDQLPTYMADDIADMGDRVRIISMTPPSPCCCDTDECHGMRDSDYLAFPSGSYVVIYSRCDDVGDDSVECGDGDDDDDE